VYSIVSSNANGRACACQPVRAGLSRSRIHVEKTGTGSAAKPFEDATGEKVCFASIHVNWHNADSMEGIEGNERTHLVRAFTNCVGVHQVRAAEKDVRDSYQTCALVDRRQQSFQIYSDAVVRPHRHDARTESLRHFGEGIAY
jgi:hypothetical protein